MKFYFTKWRIEKNLFGEKLVKFKSRKNIKLKSFFIRENVPENIKRKNVKRNWKTEKHTEFIFWNFVISDEIGFLKEGYRNFIFGKFRGRYPNKISALFIESWIFLKSFWCFIVTHPKDVRLIHKNSFG